MGPPVKSMSAATTQIKSGDRDARRADWDKKQGQLDGTVAPDVDEMGNAINPHIPQYMSDAPWYLGIDHKTLKHQQKIPSKAEKNSTGRLDVWYKKGAKGPAATKYRAGACENCGSMTHKKKDCLERPRKVGAKYTGKDIKADEIITEVSLNYAAKRDRWNGVDLDAVREEFSEVQAAMPKPEATGETRGNIRVREDVPKYLRNLSTDPQFHYDPKTRSMRANPYPDQNPDEVDFAGDNWVRQSGDVAEIDQKQLFCWEATRRLQESGDGANAGKYIHMNANPTEAEMAFKQNQVLKEDLTNKQSQKLLDAYGGEEHLKAKPDELQFVSESYVEYRADGTTLSGVEAAVPRTKYQEDLFTNGHTTVWGSWWEAGAWGYKCCKQTMKNAICTSRRQAAITGKSAEEVAAAKAEAEKQAKMAAELAELEAAMVAASSGDKEDAKASKAKEKEAAAQKRKADAVSDSRHPTADEMEQYKRQKIAADDPMKNFLGQD
eukprot:TRINITY_DN22928_c0_g1_i1.p1 TRINITY_DN22928_c0_g1~~TRINITY_DN22928_c0_g1_i1.p1  ORF type:complete len:493 (+),score=210.64 TRINITY_DN22928_c0_g1_i1:69-1547(+)